ncbi:hypothetical protein H0H93_007007 [Arthromyces matolae]|nr:hypothetical protein H0H93_007007 [Arthromyces matolae]
MPTARRVVLWLWGRCGRGWSDSFEMRQKWNYVSPPFLIMNIMVEVRRVRRMAYITDFSEEDKIGTLDYWKTHLAREACGRGQEEAVITISLSKSMLRQVHFLMSACHYPSSAHKRCSLSERDLQRADTALEQVHSKEQKVNGSGA